MINSTSWHQLIQKNLKLGKLSIRYLTLEEILDAYKKKKISCRDICKTYNIRETQAANMLKEETKLRADYQNFQGKGFKHVNR